MQRATGEQKGRPKQKNEQKTKREQREERNREKGRVREAKERDQALTLKPAFLNFLPSPPSAKRSSISSPPPRGTKPRRMLGKVEREVRWVRRDLRGRASAVKINGRREERQQEFKRRVERMSVWEGCGR